MVTANDLETLAAVSGVTLTGQLVGFDEAYSFTGIEGGTVKARPAVKLLVNEHIEKLSFDPERVDIMALIGSAGKGDTVTLPVWASGPYDAATKRSAPVRFRIASRRAPDGGDDPA